MEECLHFEPNPILTLVHYGNANLLQSTQRFGDYTLALRSLSLPNRHTLIHMQVL